MKSLANLLFAFLSFASLGCSDRVTATIDEPDNTQIAYFPLQIGKFIEYRVDSIVFDFASGGGTSIDTNQLLVREVTLDTFRDNAGVLTYRIERYERPANYSQPWTLRHIWTASRNSTQAVRTENNLRFLRLVFPMNRATSWNGNLWIDQYQEIDVAGERIRPFSNWKYDVDSIDRSGYIGNFMFDSLLYITEVDETNAVERRWSTAVYAKHTGLVRREQWILDSQYCNENPPPADCLTRPWELKGERGYIVRMYVTDYN